MTSFRAPADIGRLDFARATRLSPEELAQKWHQLIVDQLDGYDVRRHHVKGALELSKNYFDPRQHPAEATAPVSWNGFPRAMDRWHRALADVTDEKLQAAETNADFLIEDLYYWELDAQGNAAAQSIPAHLVSLLPESKRGLPRRLRLGSGTGSEVPMAYRQQDEYLEWHADRDAEGKLRKLSFTAEPPEYWEFLAEHEPELVLKLYRELVSPDVQPEDLFFPQPLVVYGKDAQGQAAWLQLIPKDRYNGLNKWNTTLGAVHLTHTANSLGAEVNLAAVAANLYACDGQPPRPDLNDDPALTRIACAGYGEINRISDPNIGEQVGLQVTAAKQVSLTDPIGLYISGVDLSALERRNAAGQWELVPREAACTIVRGSDAAPHPRILRFTLAAPAGAAWLLGDCRFERRALARGGQVARKTSMVLYADVRAGEIDGRHHACDSRLLCRHGQSRGFFGVFETDPMRQTCAQVTAEDWLEKAPYNGVAAIFEMQGFGLDEDAAPTGPGSALPPPVVKQRSAPE